MASPTLILVAKKVAVQLATDKRTWVVVGSVITGVVLLFMIPVILIYSATNAMNTQTSVIELCFNSEEIPQELGQTNTVFIENMRIDFSNIDEALEETYGTDLDENADEIFIKCVYYVLSLDGTLALTNDFYSEFVKAFFNKDNIYIDEKERVYSNLSDVVGYTISDTQKKDIDIIYNFIKYGTLPVGMSDFSGIPPEALEDEVFRQLMTEATKYLNYPYVWGGSTPETSFDCSGYICWVYTQSGVYNLPRMTAQGIYNRCVPVPMSEAKAGDLVFFTKTYKTSDPVTHVGIIIGDGRFLHCGDPIGYAELSNSYWSSHFYGVGRLPISE